jgi:hypothetical protein
MDGSEEFSPLLDPSIFLLWGMKGRALSPAFSPEITGLR